MSTGKATIALAFDSWKEGNVAPSTHEVPVVAGKPGPKREAVSARLKASLVHPIRTAHLVGLRYSPDGSRLIAGDYPGGVVQLWNAQSGEQLTKIETGYGYRGSAEYILLTPGWKDLVVTREKRKYERVERDGKKLLRWEFDGDVRVWDLESGQLRERLQHTPPRNISHAILSPDGTHLLTSDELSGEFEGRAPRTATLWNLRTKQKRDLPVGTGALSVFSPDGRSVAVPFAPAEDGFTTALKMFDVETLRERFSIPVIGVASVYPTAFSPDGSVLVVNSRVYPKKGDYGNVQTTTRLFDAASGKELASFAAEAKEMLIYPTFAPDGRTLVLVNWGINLAHGKVLTIDVGTHKVIRTIPVGAKAGPGERVVLRPPAISADGQWLALITQVIPDRPGVRDPSPDGFVQAQIHLVSLASGEVRETLTAPPGFPSCAAFSPDGKTLATGGYGRVLLWDLSYPPGTAAK